MSKETILEIENLSKEYSGIKALNNLSFDLRKSEVHVLFGENGAGKSTAISIIGGALSPTSGTIKLNNKKIILDSVHKARSLGISVVFQEFSLIGNMNVEENLFLSQEDNFLGLVSRKGLHKKAIKVLKKLDFDIDPKSKISHLTRAQQQMVEIAKAFRDDNLSVLILDEPTASLTDKETNQLYKLIDQAKNKGVGIIYITHRLAEIAYLADRVTILRDGELISTVKQKDTSQKELLKLMTGRTIDKIFPKINANIGEVILDVKNLKTISKIVKDASINVCRGEVVGLAGLVGSGKSFIARSIFGLDKAIKGKVVFKNKDCTNSSTKNMIKDGVIYLPPNRKDEGLVMNRSAKENISLNAINLDIFSKYSLINLQAEQDEVQKLASKISLFRNDISLNPMYFSGGNQQKIMLLKSLVRDTDLIIFDEPTVGVDVGTRVIIYELIKELCEQGKAILLISSDLPEVLHLSNRMYVFCEGHINAHLKGKEINEKNALKNFFKKEEKEVS